MRGKALRRIHGLERRIRGRPALLRDEPDGVGVAGAQVQRHPARDRPAVLRVDPRRVREVLRHAIRRTLLVAVVPGRHLEGHVVSEDELVVADMPRGETGCLVVRAVPGTDLPIGVGGRVVEPHLEVMVAREQVRLVPAHRAFRVVPTLEGVDAVRVVAPGDVLRQLVDRWPRCPSSTAGSRSTPTRPSAARRTCRP